MHVTYENEIEDLVRLNLYLARPWRRGRTRARTFAFLAGGLLLLMAVQWQGGAWARAWPLVALVAAMAASSYLLGPWLEKRSIVRAAEEGWAQRDGKVGVQHLELSEEELVHRSEAGERRVPWAAVPDAVVDGDLLFVMTGDLAAHVVPRRAFATEAEWTAFTDEARRLVDEPRIV